MKEYINEPIVKHYRQELPKRDIIPGRKCFDMKLPRLYWPENKTGKRWLVVLDRVAVADMGGTLLGDEEQGTTFFNVLNAAADFAKEEWDVKNLFVINFHEYILPGLTSSQAREAEEGFFRRVMTAAKRIKPDLIIFCGHQPTSFFKPGLDAFDFGRIKQVKYDGINYKVLPTLSLNRLATNNPKEYGTSPNLLGVLVDHFATAIHGKNRYTITPKDTWKSINVDTITKFKFLMKRLRNAEIPCIDTETKNLHKRTGNNILSIQISLDGQTGYFVPLFHKETPFTHKELAYIVAEFKDYFENGTSKYLIMHNGKFDLNIFRQCFGCRHINHKLYDTIAGKFSLDENIKFTGKGSGFIGLYGFTKESAGPYRLDASAANYGCRAYVDLEKGEIGKDDRKNMDKQPLRKIFKYSVKDVIIPRQMHDFQLLEFARRGKLYKRTALAITDQMGPMLQTFSRMEYNGIPVDRGYLIRMHAPGTLFIKKRDNALKELLASPSVRKANKIVLRNKSMPSGTLFNRKPWIFNINKPEHQRTLFFDVLRLEPVNQTKSGLDSTDKTFLEEYDHVREVELTKTYKTAENLQNKYIVGIVKTLSKNTESRLDGKLRPSFGFEKVLTSRSSADKGVHQIPSRGDDASPIKRMFIAPEGTILNKPDAKSHEMRNWSNMSGDPVIAAAYRTGIKVWRKYRLLKTFTPELLKEYEIRFKEVDAHIQNASRFFGVPVRQVTPEQRYDVKATIFGVMYGKSAFSLGRDILKQKRLELKKLLKVLNKETDKEKIKVIKKKIKETEAVIALSDDDRTEAAQKVMDLMFATFKVGGEWMEELKKVAANTCKVPLLYGGVRHQWAYLHWDKKIHRQQDRRGPNCVDTETECLSEHGWKKYNELKVGDLIYTKNIETGELELQPILYLNKAKYKGKMWRLDKGIDALVTPNHRWLIDIQKKHKGKKYTIPGMVDSSFIANSGNNNPIHLTVDNPFKSKGNNSWLMREVKLIGWILTDGWFKTNNSGTQTRIGLTQSIRGNPEKVKMIDYLFKTLKIKHIKYPPKDEFGGVRWLFSGEFATKIIKALPGKILNIDFLKSLTTKQLKFLYDSMMLGNGSYDFNLNQYDHFGAGTKKKADMFSMLCVLLGIPHKLKALPPRIATKKYPSMPNIPKQTKIFWIVEIKQRHRAQAMFYNHWEKYNGKVWCPTVKNGTFVARRNGSVYITGNSGIQGPSSHMIYIAQQEMANLIWEYITKPGHPLQFEHFNVVHDSAETFCSLADLPIILYLQEHSMTTRLHKITREVFGKPLTIDIEAEFEMGGSQDKNSMSKWDYTHDKLIKIVDKTIEWCKAELGYYKHFDKEKLLADISHNFKLIDPYRRKEIKESMQSKKPAEIMLLTPAKFAKIGYRFHGDGSQYNLANRKHFRKAA